MARFALPGKKMAIHIERVSGGEAAAHAAESGCDIHRSSPCSLLPPSPCRRWRLASLAHKPFTTQMGAEMALEKGKPADPNPVVKPRRHLGRLLCLRGLSFCFLGRPVTWFPQRPRPSPLPPETFRGRTSGRRSHPSSRSDALMPFRRLGRRLARFVASSIVAAGQDTPRVSFPPSNPGTRPRATMASFRGLRRQATGVGVPYRYLSSVAGGFPRACKIQLRALS